MNNKAYALLFALCISAAVSPAQNNTNSPYSTRGFGEMEQQSTAFGRGLGGATNGVRSKRTVSPGNPASYGALNQVSLDFGFRGDYSKVYSDIAAKTSYNGNFNYFGLSFPAYKKLIVKDSSSQQNENRIYREYRTLWTMGFGLMPHSNIHVSYSKTLDTSYGETAGFYNRRGGLSRFYLVNAFNVLPNLSIGLNTSVLFGQIRSNEAYYLYDSGVSRASFSEINTQLSGLQFNLGIQGERNRDTLVRRDSVREGGKVLLKTYRYPLRFVYGATLSNEAGLRYNEFRQILNRSNYYSNAAIDTVLSENRISGRKHLPVSISAGFSLTFNNRWMFAADYRTDLWSGIDKPPFRDSFANSSQLNFGIAYRPDPDVSFAERLKTKGNKLNLEYRFGFRMLNTGYLFLDKSNQIYALKEYGISFGIGIPRYRADYDGRAKVMLKSLINFTGEYIRRGSTDNGMIAEDLYRLTIGFTLSDIWFKQRKFN